MSVQDTYRKLTQEEHARQRAGMYIGDVSQVVEDVWIYDSDKKKLRRSAVKYNPGLYKCTDEIISNAFDASSRDKSVTCIKVEVDRQKKCVMVYNNGEGIPTEWHDKYEVHIPEMIFSQMLTSSNYNDQEQKETIGCNGLGAKLTNLFSLRFVLDTVYSKRGERYVQEFSDHMKTIGKPRITKSGSEPYTKVTFYPDLSDFDLDEISQEFLQIIEKRCMDISACTRNDVSVYFNKKKLPIKSSESYMDLIVGTKKETPRVFINTENWNVGICLNPFDTHTQISFVNGCYTSNGGTHTELVLKQIVPKILEKFQEKHKAYKDQIKSAMIKNNLFIFVSCRVANPTFKSQTKDENTTKFSAYQSKIVISDDTITAIMKLGICDNILEVAKAVAKKTLSRTDGSKKSSVFIEKLSDASNAGSSKAHDCTLILTEGDSAATFAVSAITATKEGRDFYGIFPCRGKLLNVRDASSNQITNNKEITNIKQILGLKQGKKYKNIRELRYGKLMILADQDVDGSHIKGLIINFIDHFWPELLELGFLCCVVTPIVKCTKGNKVLSFYNLEDYKRWKGSGKPGWKIKYYKGLGTSTAAEAKDIFKNLSTNKIQFVFNKNHKDGETLKLAFAKDHAGERKTWVREALRNPPTPDHAVDSMSFSEFLNKDMVQFSVADCIRSLPNMVDGLKPSQRKVLFACLKRNLIEEIKVSQFAGYVGEQSSYHHGEQSLHGTIIGMAQSIIGHANLPLLEGIGQFGTRLGGGEDSSSPRYIFTKLQSYTKTIFNSNDNNQLNFLNDDGMLIEPQYYIPCLPMLLINGSRGIGTGFSSTFPCFNPQIIKENLIKLMRDEDAEMTPLHPWYKSFQGEIEEVDEGKYVTRGVFTIKDGTTIEITELPIGVWTNDYNTFLDKLVMEDILCSYRSRCDEVRVYYEIRIRRLLLDEWRRENKVEDNLKLVSTQWRGKGLSTRNMHVIDENGSILKINSPEELLWRYYQIRKKTYTYRKKYLVDKLQEDATKLQERVRFIQLFISEDITIIRKTKSQIQEQLEAHNFKKYDGTYDYLVTMHIISLSEEKIKELEKERDKKLEDLSEIQGKTFCDLWKEDIDKILP